MKTGIEAMRLQERDANVITVLTPLGRYCLGTVVELASNVTGNGTELTDEQMDQLEVACHAHHCGIVTTEDSE